MNRPAPVQGSSAAAQAASAQIHSRAQLRLALAAPHDVQRKPLGALLTEAGLTTPARIETVLEQRATPETRLGEALTMAKAVATQDVFRTLSEQLGVPFVRLKDFDVELEALEKISQEVMRRFRVIPLMLDKGRLVVAMADPSDGEVTGTLAFISRLTIEPVLAMPREIEAAIATHRPPFDDQALTAEARRLRAEQGPGPDAESIEMLARERPIVRLVSNMLFDAVQRRASDIHLRPRENGVDVLYRIDGTLLLVRNFSSALLPATVARIKVLAELDLAEHRLPQDGRIHVSIGGRDVDLRISIMPAAHGENVVIRILDRAASLRRIQDIGFSKADEQRFRSLIDRNQGLLLVTGPTGSGKSTTLYAALQELNKGEYNIITVEDPIEYQLDGVVQIQVHPAIDYTFAKALRHILRHDPDIVMVGEIRDIETARMSIESALTGHLVLSTLHTNSAAQTVTRLVEMGVEPHLVNATLVGVLAQRLVRRNCTHCKKSEQIDPTVRETLGVSADEVFWKGAGCPECGGTGYSGRLAVYELLEMTAVLRALVTRRAGHDEIEAQATREGMVRLTTQALSLARAGTIALQEVYRARLE
jgi:type IV pilus assembly protein PilB